MVVLTSILCTSKKIYVNSKFSMFMNFRYMLFSSNFWPYPATCGIIVPQQGLNTRTLHWEAESQPLDHQEVPAGANAKSLQSCPTLCDPIDRSPPGSSVAGILQTRTLEWVAMSFAKEVPRYVHFEPGYTVHIRYTSVDKVIYVCFDEGI